MNTLGKQPFISVSRKNVACVDSLVCFYILDVMEHAMDCIPPFSLPAKKLRINFDA